LTLPELAGIDAGGWFHKRFAGEPLPLLEEALELDGNSTGSFPQHWIEVRDPALVGEVARQVRQLSLPLSVRLASFDREVCLEARDQGLVALLLAYEADPGDLSFVRDERLQAYATAPGALAPGGEWDCERWAWGVDEPAHLFAACRLPLNGFTTHEPLRALATRALVQLTPDDEGPYPLEVPALEVASAREEGAAHGEWAGRWEVGLGVRNPFPFPVVAALALAVRGGAFEVAGLPASLKLAPGAQRSLDLSLLGGSWSPGEDPTVVARFTWRRGPGRPEESLVLDAPLARTRTFALTTDARRLVMLREHPGEPPASMTVRRRGNEILAWVENAGGLEDVRALIRLGSRVRRGGKGVRVPLPRGFDDLGTGLPFSVGFEGRQGAAHHDQRLRRWAGGLPANLGAGAPGRLLSDGSA